MALISVQAGTLPLPERATNAPSGGQFAERVAGLTLAEREREVYQEVMAGNVPKFLRQLCPVQTTNVIEEQTNTATFFVTPDYLAVGSDADYLLMPLSPGIAQQLADKLHATLPTRKMVDEVYAAAEVKLAPSPLPPSAAMTTVEVFSNHNAAVYRQRADQLALHPLGALVAGHKKDVVISAKLAAVPGKVAIYGWHRTNGVPIQPLYLGHTDTWVDYSQCIRLAQQAMVVNGTNTTISEVLSDPKLAVLLSDEGAIGKPRYGEMPAASGGSPNVEWQRNAAFAERVASFTLDPGVKVLLNAPAEDAFAADKPLLLVFYALPNGNTTAQTVGKALQPGEDWHYDIQHIGAQTRFLREILKNRLLVVAYLENNLKSWPAWRRQHGDNPIPGILESVKRVFPGRPLEVVLSGHSGGGSLVFGYLNTLEAIPDEIVRIAFLDSNYAYDAARGHAGKLAAWLARDRPHYLCVLAYNDAVALLDGKSFVSASGGTWGKSHEMQHDLARYFPFTARTNAEFQTFSALGARVQFILKENPERKVLHTFQVERNGFIHSLLMGTPAEHQGYQYLGPRAYSKWVQGE